MGGVECSICSERRVREVDDLVGRFVGPCYAVTAILCLAAVQGWAGAESVNSGPSTGEATVRRDIQHRIAELKQRISELNARVSELKRDNMDLTERLQSRRQEKTGVSSPAVQGEPGVLSNAQESRVAGQRVSLWDSPGGTMSGARIVGQVVSGFPVRVVETRRVGAQQWIRCYTYHFTPNSFAWVVSHMVRTEQQANPPQNGG